MLFAAADGKLSVRPPVGGILDPTDQINPPDPGTPLPPTVNLFLHLAPLIANGPTFSATASQVGGITGFAYLNVETASLKDALAELLDATTFPPGSLTPDQVIALLLQGDVDVFVTAGHAIGKASTQGAGAGQRQVGFTVLTSGGPIDPSYIYDLMRDFVADTQEDLNAFLILAPKNWPVIEASLPTDKAIALTQIQVYPMAVLENLRTSRSLSPAQWRQVGNNQKQLFRNRLLKRVGHATPAMTDPMVEFDNLDAKNIFQLEAVAEFYANFDDPWKPGATPLTPSDQAYITVDFLDLAGTNATVTPAGNVVQLDGQPDLNRIRRYYNFDTGKWEIKDTIRLGATWYSITDFTYDTTTNTYTVTVGVSASLGGGPWEWQIKLRPTLLIIDCFGPRAGLRGTSASVGGLNTLTLEGPPDLSTLNPNFDTIYLPLDTARPSSTYRITAVVDVKAGTIMLDGNPTFGSGSSTWYIQAGIGGALQPMIITPGPGGTKGYDHYDGTLFVIQSGKVYTSIRWTSYTSRTNDPNSDHGSSLRGNAKYDFMSFRSADSQNRNYCFRVIDVAQTYDGVRNARKYFATPVADDSATPPAEPTDPGPGKTLVRLHTGGAASGGSGSQGCLVASNFFELRNSLIRLYQQEYKLLHGPGTFDPEVNKASGLEAQCKTLWAGGDALPNAANKLLHQNWNNKIVGALWVIRPDERPLGI